MKVSYQILFSVEILNDYFSHGKWKQITLVPLPETMRLIQNSGFQLRRIDNQLLVITPVDNAGKAFNLPPLFSKFSFALQPETPNYINFSNLPLSNTKLKCFAFNNLPGNTIGTTHYLTQPATPYSNAITYHPGDFVKGADNRVYESIKTNSGAQPPDDNVAASRDYWVLVNDLQFVSNADTTQLEAGVAYGLTCANPVYAFKASAPQTSFEAHVYGHNPVTGNYDRRVYHTKISYDTPGDYVQLDLRSLTAGKYKIKLNNDIQYIYLAPTDLAGAVPMFIDIYHQPATHPQSFLNNDDTLKHIKYTIRFGSRRVYWRFRTRTTTIDTIADSAGDLTFVADGLKYFISERPIPLTDKPVKTLSGNTGSLIITSPLPNPRVDRLLDKRNDIFTTEAFINY